MAQVHGEIVATLQYENGVRLAVNKKRQHALPPNNSSGVPIAHITDNIWAAGIKLNTHKEENDTVPPEEHQLLNKLIEKHTAVFSMTPNKWKNMTQILMSVTTWVMMKMCIDLSSWRKDK